MGLAGQEFQGYAVFQPEGHDNKDGNWNNKSYENNNNNQDSWNKSRLETKRKNSIKSSNYSKYIYRVEGYENQAFDKSTEKINTIETHATLAEKMVLAKEESKPDIYQLTPAGIDKEESSPVAERMCYDGISNGKTNPVSKLVSAILAKEEAIPAMPEVERTYNLKRYETKQDVNSKTHAAASNLAKEFERLAETILQRAAYDIIEFQKQVTVSISATECNIRKSSASDTKETNPALEVQQQEKESKPRKRTWTMTETELFEKDKHLVEADEQATLSNLNRRLLLDETPSTDVDQEKIVQVRGKRSAKKITDFNEVLLMKSRWLEPTNNNVIENTFAPDSITLRERNARVEIDTENDNEKKNQEKIPGETDIRKDCDLLDNVKHSEVKRAEDLSARIGSAGKPETMNLSETAHIRSETNDSMKSACSSETTSSMKSLCGSENTSVAETVRHLESLLGSERTNESEEVDRSDSNSEFETASESEMSSRSEASGKMEAEKFFGTDSRAKGMVKVRKRKDKRNGRCKEKNDGMGNVIHGCRTRVDTAGAPYIKKEPMG